MLQSDTASTITNLISWFSVFDFTKYIKQTGDEIFTCASLCQKLSLYGIILQSYCTNNIVPSVLDAVGWAAGRASGL